MYSDGGAKNYWGERFVAYAKRDEVVVATKLYYPMRSDPNGRGLSPESNHDRD